MPRVAYAPDDGTGAGGAGAGAAGGTGGAAPPTGSGGGAGPAAGGQAPGGGAAAHTPPAAYRPEGLPDHLAGANERETIDRLFKAYDGARKTLGDRGAVPDKPEGYTFEPSDKLKPFVQNFDKDPVYAAVRGIAHKAGMDAKQFQAFLPAVLEHFVDAGLVDAPVDAKAMLRTLAPREAANLAPAEQEQAAARRVSANTAWVDGAKAQGTLPGEVAEFFAAALASDPRAHHAVEWLRGQAREPRPAMEGGSGTRVSDTDLKARLNDPRNDPRSGRFERAFAEETDRLSKQMWG